MTWTLTSTDSQAVQAQGEWADSLRRSLEKTWNRRNNHKHVSEATDSDTDADGLEAT